MVIVQVCVRLAASESASKSNSESTLTVSKIVKGLFVKVSEIDSSEDVRKLERVRVVHNNQ